MIIVDLDGTLADCEHRRHFVDPSKNPSYHLTCGKDGRIKVRGSCERYCHKETGGKFIPDWKSFYKACDQDKPIKPTIDVFNNLILLDNEIHIWSGRCESVKDKTENWLNDHLFQNGQYPLVLKMRPIGDNTPDEVLKERWLDEAIAQGKTIDFVFDDRKKVCDMWRRRGIFVFDVNQTGKEF